MIQSVRQRLGDEIEIWGVLIQKMLDPGKEVILGVTRDERFGPVLMFGLGGIYTETFRDVAFRLAPIRENVAEEMIHEIRSIKLLEGVRGEPPSDLAAVAECLLRLSQFVTDHPNIRNWTSTRCWSTRAARARWWRTPASFCPEGLTERPGGRGPSCSAMEPDRLHPSRERLTYQLEFPNYANGLARNVARESGHGQSSDQAHPTG